MRLQKGLMLLGISLLTVVGMAYGAAERPAQKPAHLPPNIQHMPEIVIYEKENFGGDWLRTNLSYPNLANLNNKVSSVIVVSGTWRLCREYDFQDCRELKPGYYAKVSQSEIGLDTVTSLEPVAK